MFFRKTGVVLKMLMYRIPRSKAMGELTTGDKLNAARMNKINKGNVMCLKKEINLRKYWVYITGGVTIVT